jgi:hypothetical protein
VVRVQALWYSGAKQILLYFKIDMYLDSRSGSVA